MKKILRTIHSIIPNILALFTGTRYLPSEFEFTWRCITHDIFRVYEFIFWRKKGIRCEASYHINESKVVWRKAWTFESKVRFVEDDIRAFCANLFRVLKEVRVEVYELALASPGMPITMKIPYAFAIAFGGFAKIASSTTPNSGSISTSGSDRWLIDGACRNGSGQTLSAPTYNSVTMSVGLDFSGTFNEGYGCSFYYLDDPTTGSNTLSVSWTGGSNVFQYTNYYTGVVDNGISVTYGAEAAYSGTTRSQSVTPSAANGWLIWFGSGNGSLPTGVSGSYGVQRSSNGADWMFADSNTTVPASAQSVGYTNSSGTAGSLSVMGFGISSGTTYDVTKTETLVLVDTVYKSTVRTLLDAMPLVDTVTGIKIFLKSLTEQLVLVDNITRQITAVRTEALVLVDTISRQITRVINNAITLVDGITTALVKVVTLTETITLVPNFIVNGTNVIWGHITKAAAATWTKITKH